MKAKILAATAAATLTMGFLSAPAYGHAAPPEHNHYLDVPGNELVVQIGPRVCGTPQLHLAFHKFHSNVHVGLPPTDVSAQFC